MPKFVVNGAKLRCSQGLVPGTLTVTPADGASADEQPIATVMDYLPVANIGPFGLCKSIVNPQVASATSAAGGTLTPQPCSPVTTSPWSPGSSVVTIQEKKLLTDDSKCRCAWAGEISVLDAGSTDKETQ